MVAGSLGKETRIESQSTIKSVHPENLLMAVTAATALQKSKTLIEEILSFQAKGHGTKNMGRLSIAFSSLFSYYLVPDTYIVIDMVWQD